MKLAKPHIDVGLRSNQLEKSLIFWQDEVGLPYDELLKVGGGVHQHRLSLNGSVLKLNHAREPLTDAPTGYGELFVAFDVPAVRRLRDPDNNAVTLVPKGHLGVTHIGIGITVRSLADAEHFFGSVLETKFVSPGQYQLGSTMFFLKEDPAQSTSGGMNGRGFRYLTIQVYKVDTEHSSLLSRGAIDAAPPKTLGETAPASLISEVENNWIEIYQRKSLTGDLTEPS
ncbi:MAG: hypothetical protein ACI8Z1_002868 [Candidatus Azotimanducaceae bacterium]|jgi:hypothetical protein